MGPCRPVRPVQRLQRQCQTPDFLQVTMSNRLRVIGRTRSLARMVWSVMAMALAHCGAVAIAAETNQASFKISGYGPIGNRQLARVVKMLQPGDKAPAAYDPSFVEDAAVIII